MADETKTSKAKKNKSPLVGSQAQPTVLDKTVKLDIDLNKTLADNIIDAGLSQKLDITALENFTSISNSRDQIYQLIDTMANDSSVSSIVRTYAEEVCEPSDNGHIVWCESDDPNITKFVNYLLNTMNVDKNIFGWVYSLIKYGDVYLKLYRESDYEDELFKKDKIMKADSARNILNEDFKEPDELNENVNLNIHKSSDQYSYYVEMINDPSTMFELVKYGKTYGYIEVPMQDDSNVNFLQNYQVTQTQPISCYKMRSNAVNVYQADDFVHAYLEDGVTRFPEKVDIFLDEADYKTGLNAKSYTVRRGKSLLYDSYKIWREKALLEDSALLNRITRSSVIKNVQVEVGDMSKSQITNTLRRVKDMFEQKAALNTNSGFAEYTNPGPIVNYIYTATNNGKGAVTVTADGGDIDVKNLADLDWWNNKFYSSYGIPKQYFGWCLKFDTPIQLLDGTTHTIQELFEHKDEYIGKGILGCNSDGSLCPTKISNVILTNPAAKCMRIWLDNGKYVDVTPDHRMMLRDGTFIRADELVEGDSLMPYYDRVKDGRRQVLDNKKAGYLPIEKLSDKMAQIVDCVPEVNQKVTKIEYLNDTYPVYDISVEDDCHTFALACGIFVHNCDDAAGFNGGTSLSILSSVFAKGVKRVQNSILQAITDIINLYCLSKGCRGYLNNFVLKMREPTTQEEKDYRESLSNRITAISNIQSLFADVETRSRKLVILRELFQSLNLGDAVLEELDGEIDAAKKAEKKAAEDEAAAAEAGKGGGEIPEPAAAEAPAESGGEEESGGGMESVDLGNSADAGELTEVLEPDDDKEILQEDADFLVEANDELPTPEELNSKIDFTKNV